MVAQPGHQRTPRWPHYKANEPAVPIGCNCVLGLDDLIMAVSGSGADHLSSAQQRRSQEG